jgi:hypothetical protein
MSAHRSDCPLMGCTGCVEYGPARYVIVYEDGVPGAPRTLRHTMEVLRAYGREDGAVRVEPVEGTQAQITRGSKGGSGALTFDWHTLDGAESLRSYATRSSWPIYVSALRLRSPVQS